MEELEAHICTEHVDWFDRFQCSFCDQNDILYFQPIESHLINHCKTSHPTHHYKDCIIYDLDVIKEGCLKRILDQSLQLSKIQSTLTEVGTYSMYVYVTYVQYLRPIKD